MTSLAPAERMARGVSSPVPVGVAGLGMAVPDRVVTNEDLARSVDTSDEWIVTRTGIRERRVAEPSMATSDLAVLAAEEALADAGVEADDLDLVICATTSGDFVWPSTACVVQGRIGATQAGAFDVAAACSGFCYALSTAAGFIQSGAMQRVLMIGADMLTRQVDSQDRSTCVLFGDGAGAAVLTPCRHGEGLLASLLGADGTRVQTLWIPAGGTRTPVDGAVLAGRQNCIQMKGKDVYRFAVEVIPGAVESVLRRAHLAPSDVTLLVMHQANIRIVHAVAERLGLGGDKVFLNVQSYGNTSAASVPIALTEAYRQDRLRRGDIVVTVGFGAGLTWAANVMRWNREPRASA